MKKINIFYWIVTGLYAAVIILTSIPSVMKSPDSIKIMVTTLGYPIYFVPFLGVAKILGGITILVPGFPRLKEWAYAGLAFDVLGAIYSFIAIGLGFAAWAPVLIFVLVLGCSYVLYHKRIKTSSAPVIK